MAVVNAAASGGLECHFRAGGGGDAMAARSPAANPGKTPDTAPILAG
jgi:hypothetical protein